MKPLYTILIFSGLIVVLSACAAPRATATRDSIPTATARPSEEPYALQDLIADLYGQGFVVDPHYTQESELFSVPATVLIINDVQIPVYEYPDPATAAQEAGFFSPDAEDVPGAPQPLSEPIQWQATPHIFQKGRLLAIYAGDYPVMYNALARALGEQVAGGPLPIELPSEFEGVHLPPPDAWGQAMGRPTAWLIGADQAIGPAVLGFTSAFVHADPGDRIGEITPLTIAENSPLTLLIAWPVAELQAELLPWTPSNFERPQDAIVRLEPEGRSEGTQTMYTFGPLPAAGDYRLDITIQFPLRLPPADSPWNGDVHYVWRLQVGSGQLSDPSAQALAALNGFLTALQEGRYADAAALYGGSYQALQEANPTADPEDRAGLLEAACTAIGYQCLAVKSTTLAEQVSAEEFHFMVEFQNADGSLFVLGPCCGADETEMPPQSEFLFSVLRDPDGIHRAHTLPVYVP